MQYSFLGEIVVEPCCAIPRDVTSDPRRWRVWVAEAPPADCWGPLEGGSGICTKHQTVTAATGREAWDSQRWVLAMYPCLIQLFFLWIATLPYHVMLIVLTCLNNFLFLCPWAEDSSLCWTGRPADGCEMWMACPALKCCVQGGLKIEVVWSCHKIYGCNVLGMFWTCWFVDTFFGICFLQKTHKHFDVYVSSFLSTTRCWALFGPGWLMI